MYSMILAAALAAAGSPATVAAEAVPVTETATETAVAKPAKPKKICRAGEASSTGRVGTGKVCKTAEEWAAVGTSGKRSSGRSTQSLGAE